MKNGKSGRRIQLLLVGIIFLAGLSASASGSTAVVENDRIKVEYDLSAGQYSVIDKQDPSASATGVYSEVRDDNNVWQSILPEYQHTSESSTVSDELGEGDKLTIVSSSTNLPSLILEITLYDNEEFVVLAGGVENTGDEAIQVKQIIPIAAGNLFVGADLTENFSMLSGIGGWHELKIIHENDLRCANNLLVTFGNGATRRSVVVGGLTYNDYVKFAQANRIGNSLNIRLSAEDAVGKRVDPGVTYMPDDRFYMDFITANPFDNLEAYAQTVRKALDIELSTYDFPTVDLWYARGSGATNNTIGAVAEIDKAVASGFMKYAPVAVCMEPDYYGEYNQQGW